jgi:hypothetical protein
MARTFRKIRSIDLPYNVQGEIWFTLKNYDARSRDERKKIDGFCELIGARHTSGTWEALRELLTSGKGIPLVSAEYFVSETTLSRMRKEFFELWAADELGYKRA